MEDLKQEAEQLVDSIVDDFLSYPDTDVIVEARRALIERLQSLTAEDILSMEAN